MFKTEKLKSRILVIRTNPDLTTQCKSYHSGNRPTVYEQCESYNEVMSKGLNPILNTFYIYVK